MRKTYHIYQLREFEFDEDLEDVCRVHHWPHQLVVVGEKVIVESRGVGVGGRGEDDQEGK